MHPDERVRIETPEQVALELPIAGIGSRFLAVAIDTLLQIALAIGTVLALGYGARMLPDAVPRFFTLLGPAAAILVLFCIYWGYFAFFESSGAAAHRANGSRTCASSRSRGGRSPRTTPLRATSCAPSIFCRSCMAWACS